MIVFVRFEDGPLVGQERAFDTGQSYVLPGRLGFCFDGCDVVIQDSQKLSLRQIRISDGVYAQVDGEPGLYRLEWAR